MFLENLASGVTPGPTSTVHQIRVLLLELADPLLHISQRNQNRVSDIPRLPFSLTTHIHHHEISVPLILVDHVLCLGCIHAHLFIITSGKSNPKLIPNTKPSSISIKTFTKTSPISQTPPNRTNSARWCPTSWTSFPLWWGWYAQSFRWSYRGH